MPVNVIWGREDRLLSEESVRVMERNVPELQVDYIDGCGHVPQLEKPGGLLKIFGRMKSDQSG